MQQASLSLLALCLSLGPGDGLRLRRTIRVWRPSDGALLATLEGHEGPVLALAIAPTGDIISGSGDSTIKVWSENKCIATLRGHSDTVR